MTAATFGPLSLTLHYNGETAEKWGCEKLVARFALEVDGDVIVTNAPYYFGSIERAEPASAADALLCVLADLQSIEPHIGAEVDQLAVWASWADDMGAFAGDWTRYQVRDSITSFQTISAWRELILERLDGDALEELLAVAQECEQGCPMLAGEELAGAGHVGIETARDVGDVFRGARWEDADGRVYSAADVLAERVTF